MTLSAHLTNVRLRDSKERPDRFVISRDNWHDFLIAIRHGNGVTSQVAAAATVSGRYGSCRQGHETGSIEGIVRGHAARYRNICSMVALSPALSVLLTFIYPDDEAGAGYRAHGASRGWRGIFRRQRASEVPGGPYAGVGSVIEAEMLEQAAKLILRGKRDQAITLYRGLSGMTLQQATETVDAQLQALQQWRAVRPWWRRWQRYPPASRKRGQRR